MGLLFQVPQSLLGYISQGHSSSPPSPSFSPAVHVILVVVCDERTPRASATRCFTWRQGTTNRKSSIRKCFSSEGITKITGPYHTGVCFSMLLPHPLNAVSGTCFRWFCVGVRSCPAPIRCRTWVLHGPGLHFIIIHVLNGAPLELGDHYLFQIHLASPRLHRIFLN